jgi:hypothetical protein
MGGKKCNCHSSYYVIEKTLQIAWFFCKVSSQELALIRYQMVYLLFFQKYSSTLLIQFQFVFNLSQVRNFAKKTILIVRIFPLRLQIEERFVSLVLITAIT